MLFKIFQNLYLFLIFLCTNRKSYSNRCTIILVFISSILLLYCINSSNCAITLEKNIKRKLDFTPFQTLTDSDVVQSLSVNNIINNTLSFKFGNTKLQYSSQDNYIYWIYSVNSNILKIESLDLSNNSVTSNNIQQDVITSFKSEFDTNLILSYCYDSIDNSNIVVFYSKYSGDNTETYVTFIHYDNASSLFINSQTYNDYIGKTVSKKIINDYLSYEIKALKSIFNKKGSNTIILSTIEHYK